MDSLLPRDHDVEIPSTDGDNIIMGTSARERRGRGVCGLQRRGGEQQQQCRQIKHKKGDVAV